MPAAPSFSSAAEVESFFTAATGQDFITWFNARHSGRGAWARNGGFHEGVISSGEGARTGFRMFCDRLRDIFGRPANLDEFLCLSSIVINETASFRPITEAVGTAGHPGISYAFDAIPGLKRTYNLAPLNRLAGDLFNDPIFLEAHGHLALADRVRNTTDARWNSDTYPQGDFPTSTDAGVSGIILEADFFKFRGRGLIQTTFRSAYKELIRFIQSSDSPQPVLSRYREAWAGKDPETVATISSNADWDRLFGDTECIVAMAAVRIHSSNAGNYLFVSDDEGVFGSEATRSAFNVGRRVSGSSDYGRLFKQRVFELRTGLPRVALDRDRPFTPHSVTADWWKDRTLAKSPAADFMMDAKRDFDLPAGTTRLRFGVQVASGEGFLRFFNADGSEAEPAGWGLKPAYCRVEVTPRPDGTVTFRVEDGPITTTTVRSLAVDREEQPGGADATMKTHDKIADWWKLRTIDASPDVNNFIMQAAGDFGLPAGATRVRFGVYLSAGPGFLRFFNADHSEAEPAGWGRAPMFGTVEVSLSANGTVPFRVENGPITTNMVRCLGFWT